MTLNQPLYELWKILPHPEGSTIRWFARAGESRFGGYADTPEELASAFHHSPGTNFYVAPNPSTSWVGVRHNAVDVGWWSWLFLDIDPVHSDSAPRLLLDGALVWLGGSFGINFKKHPPVVIDSGRGMQAWLRLEDVPLDQEKRREARLAMRYWLSRMSNELGTVGGCRIDPTCSDLPRVMRCPGSVNLKTGRVARCVVSSKEIYAGLASRLIDRAPPEKLVEVPISTFKGRTWQECAAHLSGKAQLYLGAGAVEPGRHEKAWHLAKCLSECGLDRDEVRRALTWANTRRGPAHALPEVDLQHALDTAFSRLTGEPGSSIL